MTEHILQSDIVNLIKQFGDLGVFIAMFLESSIVPIPSEAIILGAGAIGIPLVSILIFGSIGSTIGGMFGYAFGRYAAMPTILKFGKYILIKPHHVYKAEAFAKKYGTWSVLIGRILPIVPFKVFSIAAGMTKIQPIPFIACTLIGVVPRIYLLAFFGATIIKYTKASVLIFLLIVLIAVAIKLTHMAYQKNKSKKS